MTRITQQLEHGPSISFEFFPPKTERGVENLWAAIDELEQLDPTLVSVTYGAGGSTRERTREVVLDLETSTSLTPMPHLTCVAHSRDELADLVTQYREAGLEHVLALHGDLPKDAEEHVEGDFERASQLVELLRELGDFDVGVAAHPEGHPKAPSPEEDRRHQADKLRVADFGVTQFFFRVEDYLRLMEDLDALDVDTPVIAGVIPITNARQVQRFAELSGADMPPELVERLDAVADDTEEVKRIGVEVATELSSRLLEAGAPGLHFYTLNRAEATVEVCRNIGLGNGQPHEPAMSRGG
jgi:methylenetetrahydrofolate reductase (NADPH)